MADHGSSSESQKGRFEPKKAAVLNPPKDDPITVEDLAKCDG
jgi:membrane-associated progesterone receptor component